MYHEHWGLRESPFGCAVARKYYFSSPAHEEAQARLLFVAEQGRRFGLLLGASGTGKSLLLDVLARQLKRQRTAVARANLLGTDTHELIWLLAADLGVNPAVSSTTFQLWRSLLDRVAEHRFQRVNTVLLLDEIDEADPEVLHTVTRLIQCDVSPDARLTIISAGNGANIDRLGQRLIDSVQLRTVLRPWEEADTVAFLNQATAAAGREAPIFNREAAVRIHNLSRGLPRRVSQLADLALAAGAGQAKQEIDAAAVDSVSEELNALETAQ